MKNLVSKLLIGSGGVSGVEIAQNIDIPTTTEAKDIVSIVIQLVIGVVTLIGLLKKKKQV